MKKIFLINLTLCGRTRQYFAPDDGAGTGGNEPGAANPVAEPSGGAATDPAPGATEEPAAPQAGQKVQSPEDNAKFAAIRRETEQKAMDKVVSEMGMEWNGKPIKTYAEYQSALTERQAIEDAQKHNIDPEVYTKIQTLESKVNQYERKDVLSQQEQKLMNDPTVKDLYGQFKDQTKQLADTYGVDLETAFSLVLRENIGSIVNQNKVDVEGLKKQAVQDYIEQIRTGRTPTEGGGSSPVIVTDTPKTLEDARKGALAMLRAQRNQ